jgi:hypothetical protein
MDNLKMENGELRKLFEIWGFEKHKAGARDKV